MKHSTSTAGRETRTQGHPQICSALVRDLCSEDRASSPRSLIPNIGGVGASREVCLQHIFRLLAEKRLCADVPSQVQSIQKDLQRCL